MKPYYFYIRLLILLLLPLKMFAQNIYVEDKNIKSAYPFISIVDNNISNVNGLDSFYKKLTTLKKTHKGVVRIVHIGDSHIQADMLTGMVRNKLQQFFGDAGRELVFPYQLAKSNAPADIECSSNISWRYNRLAHPEIPIAAGISGFCIKSDTDVKTSIHFLLKPNKNGAQLFNHVQFFLDSSMAPLTNWVLNIEDKIYPLKIKKNKNSTSISREIFFNKAVDNFTITTTDTNNTKLFYGVLLDNSTAGILYNTIGVNGATYAEYNLAPLFWKQVEALNAELYIISMGTNEAQKQGIDESAFQQQVNLFISNLKIISPSAEVLITTAADSYKNTKYNIDLEQTNCLLAQVAKQNNLPIWNLYGITGGYQSANCWWDNKCIAKDQIHYLLDGYQIQGTLLFNAIAKGYNSYILNH